jgi:DNA-binding IscR family transcriptional regulator
VEAFTYHQKAKSLKLIDVVKAIDGDSLFTSCGLGLKECSEKNPCPLHNKFKGVRNDIKKMLEEIKIHDLSEKLVAFIYSSN